MSTDQKTVFAIIGHKSRSVSLAITHLINKTPIKHIHINPSLFPFPNIWVNPPFVEQILIDHIKLPQVPRASAIKALQVIFLNTFLAVMCRIPRLINIDLDGCEHRSMGALDHVNVFA